MEHINIKKNINIDININIRDVHRHQQYATIGKLKGVCTCCTSLRRQPYQTNWIQCSNIVKLRIELGVVLFFCAVLPPLPQNGVDEIKSVREEHRYG